MTGSPFPEHIFGTPRNSQTQFLMDLVLTVYTDISSKTIPVLPQMGVALQSGIRQSDMNSWTEFVLTTRQALPEQYFS